MDFKALNEEVKALLENGFAVSGKRDEVQDILQKLTQEYGDLTIPEFIDKLIQAEQKGEDILEESLNESLNENLLKDSTNCSRYYYWPTDCVSGYVHGTLSNKLGEMLNKANGKMCRFTDPLDNEDNSYWRSVLTIVLSGKIAQGRLHVLVETKSPTTQKFTATLDLGENSEDRLGFGKFFKQIIKPRGRAEYGFILGSTLARYTEEGYLEALQDLVEQIIPKLTELDNSIKQQYKNVDNELEELEKVRAQAKANKIVASTTVKRALSKSAVAKKIRELQNPTPEQLARILAAIEG